MVTDLGRDYGSVNEGAVGKVPEDDVRRAVMVLLGIAADVDDARVLLDAFGFGRDVLLRVKEGLWETGNE